MKVNAEYYPFVYETGRDLHKLYPEVIYLSRMDVGDELSININYRLINHYRCSVQSVNIGQCYGTVQNGKHDRYNMIHTYPSCHGTAGV